MLVESEKTRKLLRRKYAPYPLVLRDATRRQSTQNLRLHHPDPDDLPQSCSLQPVIEDRNANKSSLCRDPESIFLQPDPSRSHSSQEQRIMDRQEQALGPCPHTKPAGPHRNHTDNKRLGKGRRAFINSYALASTIASEAISNIVPRSPSLPLSPPSTSP